MRKQNKRILLSIMVVLALVLSSFTVFAAPTTSEYPLPRNFVLYSEIESQLKSLEAKNPNVMDYQVIGQSVEGRNLYLVTITDAAGMKKLANYQKFMQDAVNNPEAALKVINNNGDYKIPVFLNASIHGNEICGTDACLKLIKKLTTDKSKETQELLKNCVILINISQNPDGRASGHRENATGTDLNRDYVTQSQPEVQAVIKNIGTKWFPTTMLDLHGFMGADNVLLEPCTIPHNPNYEFDLEIKYLLPHAEAMADAMTALTKREIDIPYKVWEDGWDDYPPIFTPMFFMYYGTLGHTLEVKFPNQQGIDTTYTACLASLQYASANKAELMRNQFAIFDRGVKGLSVEKDVTFPEAYIIPMTGDQQKDTYEASLMIKHLLNNKIIVKKADKEFTAGGVTYPAGTYVVPMKQGLRGLANTMLWNAEDVSKLASAMYDISAYSFPKLCGFNAIPVTSSFDATLKTVTAAPTLTGSFDKATAQNYLIPVENNQAYKVVNSLAKSGYAVYRATAAIDTYAPGTFVVPNKKDVAAKLQKLAAANAVTVKSYGDVTAALKPVKFQKVAVVGNDGGTYTAMKALGFDVVAVPYYKINNGYELEDNGFDALVISGTDYFWNDSYEATGITWSLDEVGQQEVIDFASTHDFIGAGYCGMALNAAVKKLDITYDYTKSAGGGQTAENGICTMDADSTDPITYSFGANETVFAYGPTWITSLNSSSIASATYGKGDSFYSAGFWKDPAATAGKTAIVHDNAKEYDAVLLGIEPAFRSYTHATYGMMANALYYLGYDE